MGRHHVWGLVAVVMVIGLAVSSRTLLGSTPCEIDVTTPQSLTMGLEAASKYGCREATLRHRCPSGKTRTASTLVPSLETFAALRQISKGTQAVNEDIVEIDRHIHKQIEFLKRHQASR